MKQLVKKCLSTATIALLIWLVNLRAVPIISTSIFCIVVAWFISDSYFRRVSKESDLVIDPKNKAVLITGCDTGFGHHAAIRLANYGFTVYATCIYEQSEGANKLRALKTEGKIRIVQLDVRSDEDVNKAVEFVEKTLDDHHLVGLINNAGVIEHSMTELCTMDHYTKQMDVNCIGLVRVTKAFLPLLRKSKKIGSRIVLVGSCAGRASTLGFVAYSMSKFAVRCYADGLRRELKSNPDWKISCSLIEPLFYATNMCNVSLVTQTMERVINSASPKVLEEYGSKVDKFKSDYAIMCQLSNPNIDEVVDTMVHILTTRHEVEAFYRLGKPLERLMILASEWLPEEIVDISAYSIAPAFGIMTYLRNKFNI